MLKEGVCVPRPILTGVDCTIRRCGQAERLLQTPSHLREFRFQRCPSMVAGLRQEQKPWCSRKVTER